MWVTRSNVWGHDQKRVDIPVTRAIFGDFGGWYLSGAAWRIILSTGDMEEDVVPPYADIASDVEPVKSHVDPRKSDVAYHVSKVLRGFYFKIMFSETSLKHWNMAVFLKTSWVDVEMSTLMSTTMFPASWCWFCWTWQCRKGHIDGHDQVLKYVADPCTWVWEVSLQMSQRIYAYLS